VGPFNLEVTQTPRFIRTLDHLVLNGKNEGQGFRRHTFHEKRSNGPIQISTWNTLTRRFSLFNADVARTDNRAQRGVLLAGDSAPSCVLHTGHSA
jgi:hypothetical protein